MNWHTWIAWLVGLWTKPRPMPRPPAPPPGPTPNPPHPAMIAELNKYRAMHGLSPLRDDPRADVLAAGWAATMRRKGVMEHGDFDGRFRAAFPNEAGAENIAIGPDAVAVAYNWYYEKGQTEHRDNILGPYSRVGVGVSDVFWVADFRE